MRALLVWSLALCGVLLCLAHVAEAQAFAVCTGKAIPEGEKHQIAIDVERSPLLARHKRAIEKMVKVSVDVSTPTNAEVMQAKEIALELNDVIPQLTKDTILILEAFVHCTAGVPYWQIHVFPLQQMLWNHYMWSNAVARKKADPTAPAPEASLHPAIPHVPADATRVEYVFAQFLLYANSRALAPLFKNVRVDATEDLSPFFKPIVIERMLEHRPQILSQMLTEGIMTSFCMYGTPEPLRKYALDFFFSEAIKGDAALDVLPSIAAAILEDSIHQIDASLDLTKAGTGAVTAEQLDKVIEQFPEGSEGNPARTPFVRMLKVYKQPENLARLKTKVVDMVAHGGARPPPSIMRRVADSLANFLGWRSDPPVAPVLETARTWVTMCPDNQPCAQHVGWVSPSEAIKIIAGPQLKRRFESFERARSLSPKGSHPSSPQHADPLPGPKTPPSSPPPPAALPSLAPSGPAGPARKQPQHFTFNVPPRTASLASTLVPGPRTPPSDK